MCPAEGQGRFGKLMNMAISGTPRSEAASVLKARANIRPVQMLGPACRSRVAECCVSAID
jgi:hypothetical protein